MPNQILRDITIENLKMIGTTTLSSSFNGAVPVDNQAQRTNSKSIIPLKSLRVWNDLTSLLPATSAADDLGLYNQSGVHGTDTLQVRTFDLKTAGASTLYARIPELLVPFDYDTGQTIGLNFHAGMITTVAGTSATLDVEVFKNDEEGGISGVDLYTGAALDINSLTHADKFFSFGSSLNRGDLVDVRIAMAINDPASGTAVIGAFGSCALMYSAR